MALTDEQLKAAKSLERALNKCGRAGLKGGVYDGGFVIICGNADRESVVERLFRGDDEESGISLHTPDIALDGGAGV